MPRNFLASARWYYYAKTTKWPAAVAFRVYYQPESVYKEVTLPTAEALTVGAMKQYIYNNVLNCKDNMDNECLGQIQVYDYGANGASTQYISKLHCYPF